MLDQVDEDWPHDEDRFRSSEHFRWLYQTDGWEGYQDDEVEEILTRPRESKPWHVPDEKIKAMVEETGVKEGIPQSLLQHAKCRRPRLMRPNGNGVHGSAAETDEEWQALLQELDAEAADPSEASGPEVSTLPRRPSVMRRSVRFEEQRDDALDRMLKHEEERRQGGQGYEEPRRKKWMITDEEFREFVLSLAKSNADPKVDSAVASTGGLTSSASAPLLKGSAAKKEMMLVHIYFVDSQDMMSIRVSPDLRIGPPTAPKGNRFTDIYGLGANTKGFAEFKKFDYQRRKWLGGFQKDWVPAWSVSLKGMIAELTGMDVARQRLFCKGVAMGNDNLTLQSWNVTDGDTLQVRFQHKISQEQMEAVRKACQAAGHHVERSVTSIHDPSLPVRAEMESSTSSDFWKPWMGRMKQPADKSQRSTRTPRDAKPVMLKDHSHTAQLRHSKHIRRCTSKSDVWMMPRWVSQDIPHHFAATGNPKHHVVNREPARFADQGIYLHDSRDATLGRVRKSAGVS